MEEQTIHLFAMRLARKLTDMVGHLTLRPECRADCMRAFYDAIISDLGGRDETAA